MPSKRAAAARAQTPGQPGQVAKASRHTLHTYCVGALPIINRLLERIDLQASLEDHLRPDGPRMRVPTTAGLTLMVRNFLLSREPIYGVAEWADRYAPDLTGIGSDQRKHLNDDRLGRCLDRLFACHIPDLVLAVVRRVIKEFQLSLNELHNDSTTVTFFGAYNKAGEESRQRGFPTLAINYGHNKDHRPDLKQLLYVLTVTDDGGVPVFFTTKSGNVTDDQTHQETWDVMRDLVGGPEFLYVADCKLATMENMNHIHKQRGKFVTVLPRTRKEDRQFRERLAATTDTDAWEWLYDVAGDDEGEVRDSLSIWRQETLTQEGYRLWWFQSTRKSELDELSRVKKIDRAMSELTDLRRRLQGPKTRFRTLDSVRQAVREILDQRGVRGWLQVDIEDWSKEHYRQTTPGRPGKNTKYVKQTKPSFDLTWEIDADALAKERVTDGVFPLITNVTEMSAEEALRAYKRQPIIEKRFSQLKTDFGVAPVYLKNVSRIQALLAVYFFALLVQTLLERELRRAMDARQVESLPMRPEGRPCQRPTTPRVVEIFEPVQRHALAGPDGREVFATELSQLQRRILKLLGMPRKDYGC